MLGRAQPGSAGVCAYVCGCGWVAGTRSVSLGASGLLTQLDLKKLARAWCGYHVWYNRCAICRAAQFRPGGCHWGRLICFFHDGNAQLRPCLCCAAVQAVLGAMRSLMSDPSFVLPVIEAASSLSLGSGQQVGSGSVAHWPA